MGFQEFYITNIHIRKVRHLQDINIPVSDSAAPKMKHLIITGKNGSGKTSLLEALRNYLHDTTGDRRYVRAKKTLASSQHLLESQIKRNGDADTIAAAKQNIVFYENSIKQNDSGLEADFNINTADLNIAYKDAEFIMAFFDAERIMHADVPNHVEKVSLKENYNIGEKPGKDFIKYLVDKKVSQSLYQTKGETEKAEQIANWFGGFEMLLRDIYEDSELTLDFDVDTFAFHILEKGREPFDFNTMSDGYAAILDIVVNILMRMETHEKGQFLFDMPGIVLVDELETHLHYELQKKVLPFLCGIFPNIQFIISTHSAFILNSISNAVIYDLEKQTLVNDGLAEYPYEGIIEGYFEVSTLSNELQEKFNRYKELVSKETIEPKDRIEIEKLSLYLDEIPDYLALDITTEYQRLKLEYEHRRIQHGQS